AEEQAADCLGAVEMDRGVGCDVQRAEVGDCANGVWYAAGPIARRIPKLATDGSSPGARRGFRGKKSWRKTAAEEQEQAEIEWVDPWAVPKRGDARMQGRHGRAPRLIGIVPPSVVW